MYAERITTVDLLDEGIAILEQCGFQIRAETELGRSICCTIKGQRCLILDPNQAPREQLDVVLAALATEQTKRPLALTPELERVLDLPHKQAG
jgi:hypothetical protein